MELRVVFRFRVGRVPREPKEHRLSCGSSLWSCGCLHNPDATRTAMLHTFWYGLVILLFFPLFLLPYHVEMIQRYHLLHQLAHELPPVTPRFGGFVLCCCVLCCVGGFAFGFGVWLVCGDFVTAYWTVHRSFTSSLSRPLNLQTACVN